MTRQRAGDPQYGNINYGYPNLARQAEARDELAQLKSMRASGAARVRIGERLVFFKTDAEMVAAISALEHELNPTRPKNVMCRPVKMKGW